jgi:hypothetical protein
MQHWTHDIKRRYDTWVQRSITNIMTSSFVELTCWYSQLWIVYVFFYMMCYVIQNCIPSRHPILRILITPLISSNSSYSARSLLKQHVAPLVHIILISWNVIFIWETGYLTRAIKRFALFDLLKSLYSDTKILSKYIPSRLGTGISKEMVGWIRF